MDLEDLSAILKELPGMLEDQTETQPGTDSCSVCVGGVGVRQSSRRLRAGFMEGEASETGFDP